MLNSFFHIWFTFVLGQERILQSNWCRLFRGGHQTGSVHCREGASDPHRLSSMNMLCVTCIFYALSYLLSITSPSTDLVWDDVYNCYFNGWQQLYIALLFWHETKVILIEKKNHTVCKIKIFIKDDGDIHVKCLINNPNWDSGCFDALKSKGTSRT